ncbi:MAG: hypothetical protein N0C90_10055 [Candidatus Thiodiazotropha endolucinida]|nr:hypothetical protein [Candidatus Thiodiazotropha taylori]MCW4261703.1 hypothetical protein [Candidatus Thiodiazotropha endolucinida]
MSLLENRVETELTKMGKIMKDTVSGLTEHMNQRLDEVDRKFSNLLADLVPVGRNSNVNSSVTKPPTEPFRISLAAGEPPLLSNSQNFLDRPSCKVKPQNFSGACDFDEFLSQFEITSEINSWQYREKSLYLANCLTGDARSILSELDYLGRRDYKTLVEKLANRFGSVNRSEIFRTQLKSRSRTKGESIPELAQAIKKLVRQAYPGVNKDVIETLSIDHFIDALSDSDIRLRVRELGPKTLADAERTALRLESHKIADRQRSRLVGQIDSNTQVKNKDQAEPSPQMESLQNSLDSLTSQVNDLKSPNRPNNNNKRAKTWKSQSLPTQILMADLSNRPQIISPTHTIHRDRLMLDMPIITLALIITQTNPHGITVTDPVEILLVKEFGAIMIDLTIKIGPPSLDPTRETGIGRDGGPHPDISL